MPNPERDAAIELNFQRAIHVFNEVGDLVFKIGNEAPEKVIELRMGWANQIFVRLALTMNSVKMILKDGLEQGTLDHFSVASLARTIIDASLMVRYLSIPEMSKDEWKFRKCVIDLHDATKRLSAVNYVLKGAPFEGSGQYVARRKHLEAMKHTIKYNMKETDGFKTQIRDQKKTLLEGREVFARGKENAIREAGFEYQEYKYIQDELSAYVHTLPVSFHVADQYGLDYQNVVPIQKDIVSTALFATAQFAAFACERMEYIYKNIDKYLSSPDELDFGWMVLAPEPDL